MSISDDIALRGFMERLLGWSNARAVELAIGALELVAERRATLVLCGADDMVPIAYALHRRIHGADRPFVVCDRRRGNALASVRSPANLANSAAAFDAARGGSLCVRASRLPAAFPSLAARLRSVDDVSFVVCGRARDAEHPFLVRPAPIHLPLLDRRAAELDRVIAEFAVDAIAELGASGAGFTAADHAWVRRHASASLAEIEKATLRLVALRTSRNTSNAAARLGMAPISLGRWIGRRALPPMVSTDQPRVPVESMTTRASGDHGSRR